MRQLYLILKGKYILFRRQQLCIQLQNRSGI